MQPADSRRDSALINSAIGTWGALSGTPLRRGRTLSPGERTRLGCAVETWLGGAESPDGGRQPQPHGTTTSHRSLEEGGAGKGGDDQRGVLLARLAALSDAEVTHVLAALPPPPPQPRQAFPSSAGPVEPRLHKHARQSSPSAAAEDAAALMSDLVSPNRVRRDGAKAALALLRPSAGGGEGVPAAAGRGTMAAVLGRLRLGCSSGAGVNLSASECQLLLSSLADRAGDGMKGDAEDEQTTGADEREGDWSWISSASHARQSTASDPRPRSGHASPLSPAWPTDRGPAPRGFSSDRVPSSPVVAPSASLHTRSSWEEPARSHSGRPDDSDWRSDLGRILVELESV